MADCPVCGSTLVRFENPPREVCPTPDRHEASKRGLREAGRATGSKNKGQKRPASKDNLKGKGKKK